MRITTVQSPFAVAGYIYKSSRDGTDYLQTRYYDPEVRRFISPDGLDYLDPQTIQGLNLYAYCLNNPVNLQDPEGTFVNTIIGSIIGGIVGGISAAINGDNVWAGIGIGAATGAIAGIAADIALATGGVSAIAIAAIGGAISNVANYAVTEVVNGREVDIGTLAIEATVGAAFNILTFGVGGGSTQKVMGGIVNNMKKNFSNTFMANTTRKIAGKIARKSTKGVVKNVVKNVMSETMMTTVLWFGSFITANEMEYAT